MWNEAIILAAQCSGNTLVSINTVVLHWAWLVVGWVTVSLRNQPPRPTQPSIPPGSVNEYQLLLGRQRQIRLIPIVDERVGVQVKLWDPSEVIIHEEALYQVYVPLPLRSNCHQPSNESVSNLWNIRVQRSLMFSQCLTVSRASE